MIINVRNTQKQMKFHNEAVKRIVKTVIEYENEKCDEVTIHFVGPKKICDLHAEYFDDPSFTDCISFPLDSCEEDYRILGDIFVCPKAALLYASNQECDALIELTLYIVHGLLHLMGYDDRNDKDRKLMCQAERRQMKHLKKLNLILT